MMRDPIGASITPVVLTYNEEVNIHRTLRSLSWAERVVVVDSGSTDATQEIARSFSNVDWRFRSFDSFKGQYEYAIHRTGVGTDYVLALDADMVVSEALIAEIESSFLCGKFAGGLFLFEFYIAGNPLAGSLYPPQSRLFVPDKVDISQVGHGHKFDVDGPVYRFKNPLIHDDRKSLEHWVSSQLSYSSIEAERVVTDGSHKWRDRLRSLGLMPPLAGALAYVRAGGPWGGAAAVHYAYERAVYECLLAMRLMSSRLENKRNFFTKP
jgi:glycosyltransferase involved in cell wall biosynthesis